ncbi:hypothetical protein LINPERHAP1_LOCUS38771 [Linum perenne]
MIRPMVRSGIGFGAIRWIATLQRYCEYVTLLLASSSMPQDPSSKFYTQNFNHVLTVSSSCSDRNIKFEVLSMEGKNSLMKLSQKW